MEGRELLTDLRSLVGLSSNRPISNRRQTATALSISVLAAVSLSITPLASRSAQAAGPKKRTKAALVKASTVILRDGPGKTHKAKALLDEGRSARVVGHKEGWAKVRLASGTEGWVRSDLLNISKKASHDPDAESASEHSRKRKRQKSEESEESSSRHRIANRHEKPSRKSHAVAVAAKPKPAAKPQKPVQKPVTVAHKVAPKPTHSPSPTKTVAFSRPVTPVMPAPVTFVAPRTDTRSEDSSSPLLRPINLHPAAAAITHAARETHAATLSVQKESGAAPKETSATPATTSSESAPATKSKEGGKTSTPPQSSINRTTTRGERIAQSALAYRGTPYRRGASGRGAFDCSGFTMYLFGKEGEQLPRTASDQFARGQPIDKSDMKPGDLVFFKNTYKHGVSHVGVYIGDGDFVHASGTGRGVRKDNLSKEYYINHWAGARRPK